MLQHPATPAVPKKTRWNGIVALAMAAVGTAAFVIAMLASAFVMAIAIFRASFMADAAVSSSIS